MRHRKTRAQRDSEFASTEPNERGERGSGGRQTYETVDPARIPKLFRVQFAENLILLGDFDEARRVLDAAAENKRDAYWWHWSAQVEQGLGRFDAALSSIDTALEVLNEVRYRSAFL